MSISTAPSSASTRSREILAACIQVSKRLENALAGPSLLIFHRSQWRCLAKSYPIVIRGLEAVWDRACSNLEPPQREMRCSRLILPLEALHRAVQEAEICMLESLIPPIGSPDFMHSWLCGRALKQAMSMDVVEVHFHRLLWTSSVVRLQFLRYLECEGILVDADLIREISELSEIWAHMDEQDDFQAVQSLLNRIMSEEEGEPGELASFILQRRSFFKDTRRITDGDDLPPFLWVDPQGLKRNPEIIGHGSYGTVQEAVWLGGKFAVKDFFYVEDNVFFEREATIQAQLRHPNVASLVCCAKNRSAKRSSLVMELMKQDLRNLLMQRTALGKYPPFSLLLAIDLMLQISLGMQYLHSDNVRIIHRDLKSSNILVSFPDNCPDCVGISSSWAHDVSPCMHLKVTDFGMAKAKIASSRYTTRPVGTTGWRAPEVFDANPEDETEDSSLHANAKYTDKADVYSFGMVCYEIFTGEIPIKGYHIQRRVMQGERPKLPPHCPPALSDYIQRCWDRDPDKRPTFSQICRFLRYVKACVFLHHDNDDRDAEWWWQPLSRDKYTCIDGLFPWSPRVPDPLVIPREMFLCKVALEDCP